MAFAKDLRTSILQAAMQGKLTKQLETDSKVTIKTIDIEVPFEIPETWVWCKIEDVTTAVAGATPSTSNTKYWSNGTIPWLQSGCCQDCEVYEANKYISQEGYDSCSTKIMPIDTIMIALTGATAGKVGHLKFEACGNQSIAGILPCEHLDARYLFYYLQSRRQSILQDCKGSAQPHISKGYMLTAILALPPIEEQKRIVRRIEEIMIRIDELEAIEEELSKLKELFPADMKAAVLQAAMQGKLTEQLDTDSSVDELLEDIKTEREKLVKEGKVKKSKTIQSDNFVSFNDDEMPFEIPDNWRWVRFCDIVSYNMGKTPPRAESEWWINDFPWVSIADMVENGHITSTKEGVSQKAILEKFPRISPKGTLIMSFKLTVGRVSILDIDAVHNEAIISIYPYADCKNIFKDYLFHILPYVANAGNAKNAIKGKTLNSNSIDNLMIPLPPIEEQNRIVAKLEQILPLIADLS